MIARITEVQKNSEDKVTLVANLYEPSGVHTNEQVMYEVGMDDFEKAKKALGIKEKGFLDIDIDEDEKGVYFLLSLFAKQCLLGPDAKLPREEVRGRILEIERSHNLRIETDYFDRYVICHCKPQLVQRYHEIFSRENLTKLPGFFYARTNEAYIGYQLSNAQKVG